MPNNILRFPSSFAPPSPCVSPRISLSAEEAIFHRARPDLRPGLRTEDCTHGFTTPNDPAQEATIQVRSAIDHIDRQIVEFTTHDRLRRFFA